MSKIQKLWEITKSREGYGIQKTVTPNLLIYDQRLKTESVAEGLTFEQAQKITREHNEMVLDLLEKIDRGTT